jgi:quinol monooxygenase YgiN
MILTAVFTAKAGKYDVLKAGLHAGAVESRKEAGVMFYLINEVEDRPNTFMNIEVYQSEAAFQEYLKAAHVVSLLEKLDDLLEVPLVVYKGNEIFNNEGTKSAL